MTGFDFANTPSVDTVAGIMDLSMSRLRPGRESFMIIRWLNTGTVTWDSLVVTFEVDTNMMEMGGYSPKIGPPLPVDSRDGSTKGDFPWDMFCPVCGIEEDIENNKYGISITDAFFTGLKPYSLGPFGSITLPTQFRGCKDRVYTLPWAGCDDCAPVTKYTWAYTLGGPGISIDWVDGARCYKLFCSKDPNEKQVFPEGYILGDESLIYQVDFQNVGNDTAFDVVVVDTLDPNLDMSTFTPISASYPPVFEANGSELTFTFRNIQLPDSTTDETNSNGFVKYSIKPLPGLTEGTIIENRASIYFDFNEPIVTNTVYNEICVDGDGDSVCSAYDNCPAIYNPDQEDADEDGIGDSCDVCTDTDADGYGDPDFPLNECATDNCPDTANPDQTDTDADGFGDSCDVCTDEDGDGFGSGLPFDTCALDNCPTDFNPSQEDIDADGYGDSCDNCPTVHNPDQTQDTDADGVGDQCDNCIDAVNPLQEDSDGDLIGDSCDVCINDSQNDADGDGFCADVDNCPTLANPSQEDLDTDGIGDSCDLCTDTDGDGYGNGLPYDTCALDNCPQIANPTQEDVDTDGIGDSCDLCTDMDGDGYGDGLPHDTCTLDNCPDTANPDQADADSNGVGDACCCLTRGDVDASSGIDVGDLTYLVAYLFQSGSVPPCPEHADVDGSGGIDVGDLTWLVAYLFQGGPTPPLCP